MMLTDSAPPTPPPKDSPSFPPATATQDYSLFRPGRLSRTGSIYSLERVSFTSQISQLTEIRLPDASSLQSSIAAIPTVDAATRALKDAAEQIQLWMQKAKDVLVGLDSAGDAEWAAEAGRDGVEEVDKAITRFEKLIDIYMRAVEDLQLRRDAPSTLAMSMLSVVEQVEIVSGEWLKIKQSLRDIKEQVELAIEFGALRSSMGELDLEIELLTGMIFQMEDHRHRTASQPESQVDLNAIEHLMQQSTIRDHVERTTELAAEPTVQTSDSLLELLARMQPLRASLDFLPMKLTFGGRARAVFPEACQEIVTYREELEEKYARLEADAEALRLELGEDRWNLVFRNAGKQALRMIASVERGLARVDECLGHNTRLRHSSTTLKTIESYHSKKQHLCPAIERVLAIIERGVKDRLTVNGFIVRLRADIRQKWQTLQIDMASLDAVLEEYGADDYNQAQLRDSVSTILSGAADQRSVGSSAHLTPGSSPPSSGGHHSRRDSELESQHPALLNLRQKSSNTTLTSTPQNKRYSSMPVSHFKTSISTPTSNRISSIDTRSTTSPSGPYAQNSDASYHYNTSSLPRSFAQRMAATPADNRPRWTYTNKSAGGDYDVSAYYASLMAKGKNLSKPSPRVSSAPHPSLAGVHGSSTSKAATPSPGSRAESRNRSRPPPLLRAKRSEAGMRSGEKAAWPSPAGGISMRHASNITPAANDNAARRRSVSHSVNNSPLAAASPAPSTLATGVAARNASRSRTPLASAASASPTAVIGARATQQPPPRSQSRQQTHTYNEHGRRISMIPQPSSSPRTSMG